ncbi:MAG TPA: hypothetical protein VGH15_13850 [Caulobacteraceae bacterium]|jgi:hypothetical protein
MFQLPPPLPKRLRDYRYRDWAQVVWAFTMLGVFVFVGYWLFKFCWAVYQL